MKRRGVILAGGRGLRLQTITHGSNKHLLSIHDRPMIAYPLTTLLQAGIDEILIVTNPADIAPLQQAIENFVPVGYQVAFAPQTAPRGIADALLTAAPFIAGHHSAIILGDNIFCGTEICNMMKRAGERPIGATVFAYPVADPERFGVITLDDQGRPLSLEEKPQRPSSNLAVTGLYFYDDQVLEIAKEVQPSTRGELEITDINRAYMDQGQLTVEVIHPPNFWFDVGTPESLARLMNRNRSGLR